MATHASITPTPHAFFRDRLARSRRAALETWIERAISLCDDLDGDADRELDGTDEVSLQPEIRGGCHVEAA